MYAAYCCVHCMYTCMSEYVFVQDVDLIVVIFTDDAEDKSSLDPVSVTTINVMSTNNTTVVAPQETIPEESEDGKFTA